MKPNSNFFLNNIVLASIVNISSTVIYDQYLKTENKFYLFGVASIIGLIVIFVLYVFTKKEQSGNQATDQPAVEKSNDYLQNFLPYFAPYLLVIAVVLIDKYTYDAQSSPVVIKYIAWAAFWAIGILSGSFLASGLFFHSGMSMLGIFSKLIPDSSSKLKLSNYWIFIIAFIANTYIYSNHVLYTTVIFFTFFMGLLYILLTPMVILHVFTKFKSVEDDAKNKAMTSWLICHLFIFVLYEINHPVIIRTVHYWEIAFNYFKNYFN